MIPTGADTFISIAFAVVIVACVVTIAYVVVLLVLSAPGQARVRWAVRHQGLTVFSEEVLCMQLTNEQMVSATLVPTTQGGKPALVENVHWDIEPAGVVTAWFSEDGLTGTFTAQPVSAPATAQITVKADPKIGEGEGQITAVGSITVVPAEAAVLQLQFGEPEQA